MSKMIERLKELNEQIQEASWHNTLKRIIRDMESEPAAPSAGVWVKASERLPPINTKVLIEEEDGRIYRDESTGWDKRVTDYRWLDESQHPLPQAGSEQTCMYCQAKFIGEDPKYCCTGRDCGCMGLPIDPVVCSKGCYEMIMNRHKPQAGSDAVDFLPRLVENFNAIKNVDPNDEDIYEGKNRTELLIETYEDLIEIYKHMHQHPQPAGASVEIPDPDEWKKIAQSKGWRWDEEDEYWTKRNGEFADSDTLKELYQMEPPEEDSLLKQNVKEWGEGAMHLFGQRTPKGMESFVREVAERSYENGRINERFPSQTLLTELQELRKLKDSQTFRSAQGQPGRGGSFCTCSQNDKPGQTMVWCCNNCGLPDEKGWEPRLAAAEKHINEVLDSETTESLNEWMNQQQPGAKELVEALEKIIKDRFYPTVFEQIQTALANLKKQSNG